ncbi:MAG: LAGLIDADG family homing endonuclease [Candidatus Micrarchaeota archaeon]
MAGYDLDKNDAILGRSFSVIEKYGTKGTAYIGKVVMSAGENPVLGRRVVMDVAEPHLILICGKRGGGKCVTGDTLITLEDGSVLPIRELESDSRKIVSLNQDYKITASSKDAFFRRTVNEVLEVTLRSGKKITLTPEHPLLTIDGWKSVQELTEGSRIAVPRVQPFFGNEFVSEAETKLLAYLIAEGHTARKVVWFTNTDEKIRNEFSDCVTNFDSNMVVKKSPKYNLRAVSTTRKPFNSLRHRLLDIGIYNLKSHDKFIPQIIFKSSEQKVALFLNRLFSCDGTIYFDVNTGSWRISYASVSEKLIRQVQHLLGRFGIQGVLRSKKTKANGKTFSSFELELKGQNVLLFLQKIGFFGQKEERQKRALADLANRKWNPNVDTVPKEIWNQYVPQNWASVGRKMGFKYPKSLREAIHYAPSRQKLLQIARLDGNKVIEKLADSDIFWDEIKTIQKITGETDVFDISVPEHHNFVANDIIIHNSYTLCVLMEELARLPPEVRSRIAVIAIDTVGIFWTLKIPNKSEAQALFDWGLKPEGTNAKVLVPAGKIDFYKKNEIPVDGVFTLKVSELDGVEWLALFKLTWKDADGVLLTRIVELVKERLGSYYGIDDLIRAVQNDTESELVTRQAVVSRLKAAKTWGLLEKEGTKISEMARPGQLTVIDVSAYRQAIGMEGTRDIIVALLGKKLFEDRMLFRKEEEARLIRGETRESKMPIVWMLVDEAHMFMPRDEENIALEVLLEWVRVGRQPGLSLVLATQRPEKLHPDAISQADIFISHRMTSQVDIQAVSTLRPTYMTQSLDKLYAEMPRGKGFALIIDDNTEKIWNVRIRPRFSWDGGVTATAFRD